MEIEFTWDNNKAQSNEVKHGINFHEAKTVFYDDCARIIHDPDNPSNEERYIILGLSTKLRILVVVHCYRENDNQIRIISARKATRNERKTYEGYL